MAKRKKPAAKETTFAEWRAVVMAELKRREIPASALEGRLTKLYITHRTPQQAVAEAEVAHYNATRRFTIGRKRR